MWGHKWAAESKPVVLLVIFTLARKRTSEAFSLLTTHSLRPFWFFSNWKIRVGSPTFLNSLEFWAFLFAQVFHVLDIPVFARLHAPSWLDNLSGLQTFEAKICRFIFPGHWACHAYAYMQKICTAQVFDLHELVEMWTYCSLLITPNVPRKTTSYLRRQTLFYTCLRLGI